MAKKGGSKLERRQEQAIAALLTQPTHRKAALKASVALSTLQRWLSEEPDPRELMRPFPASPMRIWPISTRVNKPENDDPSIVESIELATAVAKATSS